MNMDMATLRQGLSFIGAALILVAYAGQQMGRMNVRGWTYNLLNVLGSGVLGYIALRPFSIGFVILEFTWAAISLWAMLRPKREA
jgi:hypothetical protein